MFKTDGFEPSAYTIPPRAQYYIQLLSFWVVIAIAAFYYFPFLIIFACKILKPPSGFEPEYTAYKAVVLPLDDEGKYYSENISNINTLSNPYVLDSFPHIFQRVRIMRAFKGGISC